ncbi:Enzymatic polyprotein [Vitis vinifera]|uniref:Enzymatic polyprotein n=1 Tax=Vitis vinifera TaxID=29760 RepID=A0A438G264_VITVI|nr:Enzymatic polyprotein [Vitis vinifera]
MKSGFWQIQIAEKDRYKTAFVVPFGHYEWNVMPFGLKNAPSEFQNIMNEIFNQFSDFIIVYIDDVLIYSDSVEQHWKHLNKFVETVKSNGLSLSATKINLFQTKVRFLGHHIHQGTFTPIQRSIEFADKFPDEIKDKKQLQLPWNDDHTKIVKIVKSRVKTLPCLTLADHKAFKIVETDASDIGFGEFLSKKIHKIMAPKTEKQPFKKSSSYMKPHSVLSEKFKPLYYDFASGSQESTSDPNPPVLKHPSSPVVEEEIFLARCRTLEKRLEIVNFPRRYKPSPFSPLEIGEKKPFTPLDLHIYLSAIPGLNVPGLNLTKEMEFDGSKLCRIVLNRFFINMTTSQFAIAIEISLSAEPTLIYSITSLLTLLSKENKAPEWISRGKVLPAQHYVNLHYQNRRPTLLSSPLVQTDICAEPIIKQIKHWRVRVISRDFEAYPKNMGHLIAVDSLHQIFCSKKIDPLPFKSNIQDTQLLMDYRSEYIPP